MPDRVVPLAGAVSEMDGCVVSGGAVGAASSIPRSSTVSEPLLLIARPKLSPLALLGTTGVTHVAWAQPLEAGNVGLSVQYVNVVWSLVCAVKYTGTVDMYQLVMM